MPRTETYQLRLTKAEKDWLGGIAAAKEISIARLIRTALGLADVAGPEPVLPKKPQRVPRSESGVLSISPEEANGRELATLTLRLKSQGYTSPVAERMARKQLGL